MPVNKKVIIWGYSNPNHTHYYTHEALLRAFEFCGYEVHFFDDQNHPNDFDYSSSIFFTEGFADNNIPIRKDGIYFVHVCVNPQKYLDKEVKKLVDVRYLMNYMNNDNYNFVLDRSTCEELDKGVLLEKENNYPYEIIYMAWATNLLPDEINLNWAREKREKKYYFAGSLSNSGRFANGNLVTEFAQECNKNGISFQHIDPWKNPVPEEEHRRLITKSYLSPDFRNEQHKEWGYIACRLMKSISFGQLGLTNCPANASFLGEGVVCSDDPSELFYLGEEKKEDYETIESQMNSIKNHHTFVNRVRGLEKLL